MLPKPTQFGQSEFVYGVGQVRCDNRSNGKFN